MAHHPEDEAVAVPLVRRPCHTARLRQLVRAVQDAAAGVDAAARAEWRERTLCAKEREALAVLVRTLESADAAGARLEAAIDAEDGRLDVG